MISLYCLYEPGVTHETLLRRLSCSPSYVLEQPGDVAGVVVGEHGVDGMAPAADMAYHRHQRSSSYPQQRDDVPHGVHPRHTCRIDWGALPYVQLVAVVAGRAELDGCIAFQRGADFASDNPL